MVHCPLELTGSPSYIIDDMTKELKQKLTTGNGALFFVHNWAILKSTF
jgi:hypothetical protein